MAPVTHVFFQEPIKIELTKQTASYILSKLEQIKQIFNA